MMTPYKTFTALDVETTGLRDEDEIIEIGLVHVEDGQITETWQSFIKPSIPIPADITVITGITSQMVKDAPSWDEIEEELSAHLQGQLLLAHNYRFDKSHIESQLGRTLANPWLDTHDIAKLFLPRLTSYKLMSLADHLQVNDSSHHRALNDAEVCAKVYLKLLEIGSQYSPFVLTDAASLIGDSQKTLFNTSDLSLGGLLEDLAQTAAELEAPLSFVNPEETADFVTDQKPRLSFDQAADFFAPGGLLSASRPDFQYRPQQAEMLATIEEAFTTNRHALIEAGTGTGKSLAYLVPALLYSYENDTRVVIATESIALQEQLYYTDLPFLKETLGAHFPTALAKGRANYLCLRRFEGTKNSAGQMPERDRILLASLVLWMEKDATGDREHLNLNKAELQTWQNVSSSADTCLGRRCAYFDDCFFFNRKRACEKARVIVTNHSLLLQDLKLGGLIPEYNIAVIDEAHHLEDEATRQFTDVVDYGLMVKLMANFTRSKGLLNRMDKALAAAETESDTLDRFHELASRIQDECKECNELLKETVDMACSIPELEHIGDLRITDKVRNSNWWLTLEESLRNSQRYISSCVKTLDLLLHLLEDEVSLEAVCREASHARDRLQEQADWLERFIAGYDDDFVYWATTMKSSYNSNLTLSTANIDVCPILHDKLFEAKDSVILTSATLAVNNAMTYTAQRFLLEDDQYISYITSSPFDYKNQSLIAIPNNHPDYSKVNDFAYTKIVTEDLRKLIPALGGDMLVLFTSYAMLNRVALSLKRDPSLTGYRILAHGQDGSRSSILEAMQNNRRTVVLGTKSFWEGIDVKGDHLRTLVIAKLPFEPPSMPIESARLELLKAQKQNAFKVHSLPRAILQFRQGCGRLIRSNDDRGCIIILDNRVIMKSYGKYFLSSLPEQPIWQDDIDTLAQNLAKWHAEK